VSFFTDTWSQTNFAVAHKKLSNFIILKDAFINNNLIFWIDLSVRFKTSNIESIIKKAIDISFISRYLSDLEVVCYTNVKMFKWFNENPIVFNGIRSLEANVIIINKSIVSLLLIKAWITCALDVDCIAPKGSSLYNCCGCHRYDQSALTIISTYFYGYPMNNNNYTPSCSFKQQNILDIDRTEKITKLTFF
jgi:hypothetical protein